MKLAISQNKKSYIQGVAMKLTGVVISGALILENEFGYNISTSSLTIPIAVLLFVIGIVIYINEIRKPYAEIADNSLIINSVQIEKDKIKSMEYRVEEGNSHVLCASIEGFSEWELIIKSKDVEINNLAVYHFINDHFYPVKLID